MELEDKSFCCGEFSQWDELKYPLHVHFKRQAEKTPKNVAVIDGERQLSYEELDRMTDVLAKWMQIACGIEPDDPVGMYLEKSIEYVIAYIAILKAGGAYCPIDVSYPDNMITQVLKKVEQKVVLTDTYFEKKLPQDQRRFVFNEGWSKDIIEVLERDYSKKLEEFKENRTLPLNLAYYVFSSGSTGTPKAISCPHVGSVNSYFWRIKKFPYDSEIDEREGCNIFFTWEMLRPLLCGVTLVIIPQTVIYNPPELCEFIQKYKITRVLFTPSTCQAIFDIHFSSGRPLETLREKLRSLKLVLFCGNVVKMSLFQSFRETLPKCKLVNLYSISECHDVTCSEIDDLSNEEKYASTGNVLDNSFYFVLDIAKREQSGGKVLEVVPKGEIGELYVGGISLAREYHKSRVITRKSFIKNPFEVQIPGWMDDYLDGNRLYKTGDLARILKDGSLEIRGRCNSMVKIRGYSIELNALESFLNKYPKISSSVCIRDENEQLIAYVVLTEETTGLEIRKYLQEHLPHYYIPNIFMKLPGNRLPISPAGGKLEHKSLPVPEEHPELRLFNQTKFEEAKTPLEKEILEIWRSILPKEKFGVTDQFMDVGGTSIKIAKLFMSMKEKFRGKKKIEAMKLPMLYEVNHIRLQAQFIEGEDEDEEKIDWVKECSVEISEKVILEKMKLRFLPDEKNSFFLTGATGYLGCWILNELVKSFPRSRVYCLVRKENGRERLLENLQYYSLEISEEHFNKFVIVVKGDFSKENFNVSKEVYADLQQKVDFVIHNGADVNFMKSYSQLKLTNVLGTKNVLDFCFYESKPKALLYVSTNGVFSRDKLAFHTSETISENPSSLESGYCQSKWVAEKIVTECLKKLPGVVVRPGEIVGDSKSGRYNPSHDFIQYLSGCVEMKKAPLGDNRQFDFTPVDYVAKEIIRKINAVSVDMQMNKFNLIHPAPLRMVDIMNIMKNELGYTISFLKLEKWLEELSKTNLGLVQFQPILERLMNDQKDCLYESVWNMNEIPSGRFLLLKMVKRMISKKVLKESPVTKTFGKTAIITGASVGIGKAISLTLARNGINVVVSARRENLLRKIKEELDEEKKLCVDLVGEVEFKTCDVTKTEELEKLVAFTLEKFASVDYFVANAGIMPATMLKNAKIELWKSCTNVNVNGLLNSIYSIVNHMVSRKKGHIILMSSDAGIEVWPTLAVYSATKFFTEAMASGLRKELSSFNIKVTSIQPGDVKDTEIMKDNQGDNEGVMELEKISAQRMLVPEDIAKSVLFSMQQTEDCAINTILVEPIM